MKKYLFLSSLFISSIVFSQAITDTGTKVEIGTTTPADKLTVESNNSFRIYNGENLNLVIRNDGNVRRHPHQ